MNDQLIHQHIEQILPEDAVKFCVPGHRQRFINNGPVGKRILRYDITELDGADNLQVPKSILKEAQIRAAKVFESKESLYSVNGSTTCINAAILAACKKGEKIIIDRSCHISVINSLILSGAIPVFVERSRIVDFDIDGGLSVKEIKRAIADNPDAKAVFITSPTYYGVCSDVNSIAKVVHDHDIPLIVDEAHGSHFIFSGKLPLSATESGADVVINSLHKTLPCVTQGALLNINSKRIDPLLIKEFLNIFQTTSPSYLIMSSIDSACALMQDKGEELWTKMAVLSRNLSSKISGVSGMKCLNEKQIGQNDIFDLDPTRLVLNFSRSSITSQEVADRLQKYYKIYCEMVDRSNFVNVITVGNNYSDLDYFRKKILTIIKGARELPGNISLPNFKHGHMLIDPSEAFYLQKELVPIQESVGKVSARPVYSVPPGSVILCPGEEITQETVDFLISSHNTDKIWIVASKNTADNKDPKNLDDNNYIDPDQIRFTDDEYRISEDLQKI